MKSDLAVFEKLVKINFSDKQLLENIFIHRSYLNENKSYHLPSNEKLEFLGDSVLSLITSVYLYKHYPDLKEGDYTEIKAAIVRTESLAEAAKNLRLGEFLYLSKGQDQEKGRTNKNLLADCFEAVIGAIFLDQGFDTAYEFVLHHLFGDTLSYIVKNKLYMSPKSRLQEYSQAKYKVTPTYQVIEEKGPEHLRTYRIQVLIQRKKLAVGTGQSKKQAEENAAKLALQKLKIV